MTHSRHANRSNVVLRRFARIRGPDAGVAILSRLLCTDRKASAAEAMRGPVQIIALENEQDEMIVRRLATGLVQQWDRIPKHVQGDILRDAALAEGKKPASTHLREQITTFIHKHAGDRP